MGDLTAHSHKSLVKLSDGESIFERQIRLLSECGIKEFVVTTGLYEEQFKAISDRYKDVHVTYVNNHLYDHSNYIYSFYLARHCLDDDFLLLHGDLVFNKNLVKKILSSKEESLVTIDPTKPLPEKDFKGRLRDNKLKEVSIKIFDADCFALQPFYKLSKKDINTWMDRVVEFVEERKELNVYAENALNEVSDETSIVGFDASNDYIEEIDNLEDYARVGHDICLIDFREQDVRHSLKELPRFLDEYGIHKPLVVLDAFLLNNLPVEIPNAVYFSGFKPNPLYEDVLNGIAAFKEHGCDGLISIGGGSAIDVAKTIKMFLPLDNGRCYIGQEPKFTRIKHIAIPTTAGTGSESTRYAVVYYEGKKQSLTADFLVPDVAILDESFLKTLPYKQKVATLMDALGHSIESLWSVNATEESQNLSKTALSGIISNIDEYLNGNHEKDALMLGYANMAGKAINLTETTAAHAMSYKLTSLYHIPHGQAVALCLEAVLRKLAPKMIASKHPLGDGYLKNVFSYLEQTFGVDDESSLADAFSSMLDKYGVHAELTGSEKMLQELAESVNPVRLKNFPIALTEEEIKDLYRTILS